MYQLHLIFLLNRRATENTCHLTEAATEGIVLKTAFLKVSQNSQENTCVKVSFLIKLQATGQQLYQKRESGRGVFV